MEFTYTNQVEWIDNQGWDSRIHVAANGELVNVFLVVTARYMILVDTLINPSTATALIDRARPFLSTHQLLVINTHADWDHAWGNQLFAGPDAPFPAPIIAHQRGLEHCQSPSNIEFLRRMQIEEPQIFRDVEITKATLTFDNDLWIDGSDLTLHLFPTPGHTPDHLAIYIPEISTLLAGDAAELPFPFLYKSVDLPTLRASLHKMADYHAQHVFYCHAPVTTGSQLILDNIAYYDALEAACRTGIERGLDIDHIVDADLPSLLECLYEAVTPHSAEWDSVTEYSRTVRHGQQLRLMFAWLQGRELIISGDI